MARVCGKGLVDLASLPSQSRSFNTLHSPQSASVSCKRKGFVARQLNFCARTPIGSHRQPKHCAAAAGLSSRTSSQTALYTAARTGAGITHSHKFDAKFLQPCATNHHPLTPLSFLLRTAKLHPHRIALIYKQERRTYEQEHDRIRRLASALTKVCHVQPGDVVSVMAPNIPAIYELHFAVPGCRAVLHAINTRLDPAIVAFQLEHAESKVLFVDQETAHVVRQALHLIERERWPLLVDIEDPSLAGDANLLGEISLEGLISQGDPLYALQAPNSEHDAVSVSYTSGTTGNPKGVVKHHRGAYLNALANNMLWNVVTDPPPVYLWTLPMFHCNGWCFPWAMTAVGGTHVCLRHVRPADIFSAIKAEGVTHMCGAPVVMNMMLDMPAGEKEALRAHLVQAGRGGVRMLTAGAPPPPSVMRNVQRELGIHATTAYGLTESYGSVTAYVPEDEWERLPPDEQDERLTWQVNSAMLEEVSVLDPITMEQVPADGRTLGEVMLRGNTLMKGYLKNEAATQEAFQGGWFRSGDLAVQHPGGRFEVKDRAKDVIISGGENISSIEVETALYQHPCVLCAAVVAIADDFWGEVPCAVVELKTGTQATEDQLMAHARLSLAKYKLPKRMLFEQLPKTSTGKIQKFELRKQLKERGIVGPGRSKILTAVAECQ